jgi:hypothetical protein
VHNLFVNRLKVIFERIILQSFISKQCHASCIFFPRLKTLTFFVVTSCSTFSFIASSPVYRIQHCHDHVLGSSQKKYFLGPYLYVTIQAPYYQTYFGTTVSHQHSDSPSPSDRRETSDEKQVTIRSCENHFWKLSQIFKIIRHVRR